MWWTSVMLIFGISFKSIVGETAPYSTYHVQKIRTESYKTGLDKIQMIVAHNPHFICLQKAWTQFGLFLKQSHQISI